MIRMEVCHVMDDLARPFIMEDLMSDVASNITDTVVNEWLSVEAAALRMGISSRSIARRIQNGQLESRVDANGRRTVLICLPAPAPSPTSQAAAASDGVRDGSLEPGQARELAQQAMTVVIRSHEETMLSARAEMFAARRSSRRAWAAVAILLVGASVTVGIVTHNLTAASALVHQAESKVDQAQTQVITLTAERDQLRDQMMQARVKEAQAQGQLAGMTVIAKPPTTIPSTVAQRFASVLFGD
jgi:outer membrane murein-binding lipoprotein Lpp